MTLLIIEPHEVCRHALGKLVDDPDSGLELIGEASTVEAGAELAASLAPDVILVGLDGNGATAGSGAMIGRLRATAPESPLVILCSVDDGDVVYRAVDAGAAGVVPKWATTDEILETLRSAARGEPAIHPQLAAVGLMAATERSRRAPILEQLTPRELTILEKLASGSSSAKIAEGLFISRRTVESHIASLYRKLGVHNRVGAMQLYLGLRKTEGASG